MDKPTCETCPYWESGVNSWWRHLRLDFWLSVRGVGAKTAEVLIANNVHDMDSFQRLQESRFKLGDATADNVRSILEIGDTERICGICRVRARANGTEFPTAWAGDWCGEHPDFPAWIESQRKPPSGVICPDMLTVVRGWVLSGMPNRIAFLLAKNAISTPQNLRDARADGSLAEMTGVGPGTIDLVDAWLAGYIAPPKA